MLLIILVILLIAAPFALEARRIPWDSSDRAAAPGEFVELEQGFTHYRWHGPGRGPVAVCVHGLTTPSFVWDAVIERLAAMGFRVLSYDLYGRGYSDRPRGAQDRQFFLRQLDELLYSQEIDAEISLFGYSMGGSIATAFAAEHGPKLQRLVLIAPSGLSYSEGGLEKFARTTPVVGDWLAIVAAPLLFRRGLRGQETVPTAVPNIFTRMADESRIQGFARTVLASQRGMLSEDLSDDHAVIEESGLPLLAIWGENDPVISVEGRDRLAALNPAAHQVTIAGAGHGLPYENPDEVIGAVREFLHEK